MSAQPKRNARPKRAVAPRMVPIALRTTPVLLTRQLVIRLGTLTVEHLTGLLTADWTIVSLSARVFASSAAPVCLTLKQGGTVTAAWTFRGSCNTNLLPYVGHTFDASAPVQLNVTARMVEVPSP